MLSAGKLEGNSEAPEENQTFFSIWNPAHVWANMPLYAQGPWWETSSRRDSFPLQGFVGKFMSLSFYQLKGFPFLA